MFEIALTPKGHLIVLDTPAQDKKTPPALPQPLAESLTASFKTSPATGLVHLATLQGKITLPPPLAFWRAFGERYLTALCHIPEPAEDLKQPLPIPAEDLIEMVLSAPPMRGGEYLQPATLTATWKDLDTLVRQQIAALPGGLGEWLQTRSPLWHRVGRVCFHLAENKRDPEFPFAFLATYAPKILHGSRVQYQPLGRALEEYAGERNKKMLLNLLMPVQRAAKHSAWVQNLVNTGEVFHPLAWTPQEAHQFLTDIPLLEECGLLVRVPNWWTRRAGRVRVGISIGNKTPSRLGAASMLDFQVAPTLDGETLTAEEWQSILDSAAGLVFLKGRWVEVDRDKLQEALHHWKQIEQDAGSDGLSFLEGMRLLAGTPLNAQEAAMLNDQTTEWSQVMAGHWLQESLQQIRHPAGIEVALPPPDLKGTLRPYQQAGVKWLWLLTRLGLGACLADDMGLGKTIQVLSLLLMLKKESSGKRCSPALLILPASLLGNWKAEIERFAPSLRCFFAHPSQTRPDDLKSTAADPSKSLKDMDVVLTTYSMMSRMEWLGRLDWSVVVLDEAQAIKNPSARQTRAVKQVKASARIALTGTPVENRLTDLWSIFDFLCPGLLGSAKTFSTVIKRLQGQTTDSYAPLRNLVSPYILRRMKTDKTIISDLPEKVELQAFCHLSKRQAVLYDESVRALTQALQEQKDGIARRGLILAFIMRFKQICNHPDQWLGTGSYNADQSGKFARLREICDEIAQRQEKALIFSQFREMTAPLALFLEEVFGREGLVLHGGTPVAQRKGLVDTFQREDGPPFMVLSLKAGGTGLNLTAAAHVIHFDRWWNPAVENQATDRAFRIGQTRNVMVHKFVCQGTIEEKIDALIREKTALAGEILEQGAANLVTEMSDSDLLDMVRLDISKAMEA